MLLVLAAVNKGSKSNLSEKNDLVTGWLRRNRGIKRKACIHTRDEMPRFGIDTCTESKPQVRIEWSSPSKFVVKMHCIMLCACKAAAA